MTCSQFRESLDCCIDGELAPEAAAAAERHRRDCAACDRIAARVLATRAAVVRTVSEVVVPDGLDARIRAAIMPSWRTRIGAAVRRHPARWATAAALVLAVAGAGSVAARWAGPATADVMEDAALRLDEVSSVVIEGTVLCRDCELEHRYGVKAPCRTVGHHGAIAGGDGRIWNLVEQSAGVDLIHNESLLGRRVVVHGRLYRGARTLVVDRFELRS